MRRRDFLRMSAAAPALALGGCKLSLSMEQGLKSECRNFGGLAGNALFDAAWKGLKPERVWDVHVHLFGNGRSRAGIWVEPDYDQPKSLGARMRHTFFKNGGCTGDDDDRMDQGAVDRLQHIADDFPAGAKFMLLAFDFTYDESGRKREDLTTFSVSNAYARRVANARPDRFEWIASVHPYREDAVQELEAARAAGARALKWLPPSMAIDMRSPKCLPVYDALARMNLPLLVHVGEERAVAGAQRHELANPLHLRAALDRGVRVIGAHCASLGESPDLDKSKRSGKGAVGIQLRAVHAAHGGACVRRAPLRRPRRGHGDESPRRASGPHVDGAVLGWPLAQRLRLSAAGHTAAVLDECARGGGPARRSCGAAASRVARRQRASLSISC